MTRNLARFAVRWLDPGMSDAVSIKPVLYVKIGCGWCEEVIEYLDARQIPYRKVVVSGNAAAFQEMVELSGQTRAPTMDWDGDVLADFGVEELMPFLRKKGLA